MNVRSLLPILVFAVLVLAPSVALACPNCSDTASTVITGPGDDPAAVAAAQRQSENTVDGYETSILLMIGSVLTLLACLVAMIVRTVRRIDAAQTSASPTSSPTPSH